MDDVIEALVEELVARVLVLETALLVVLDAMTGVDDAAGALLVDVACEDGAVDVLPASVVPPEMADDTALPSDDRSPCLFSIIARPSLGFMATASEAARNTRLVKYFIVLGHSSEMMCKCRVGKGVRNERETECGTEEGKKRDVTSRRILVL